MGSDRFGDILDVTKLSKFEVVLEILKKTFIKIISDVGGNSIIHSKVRKKKALPLTYERKFKRKGRKLKSD